MTGIVTGRLHVPVPRHRQFVFGMTELRVFTTSILGSVPAAFYWALGLLLRGGVVYLNRLWCSSCSRSSKGSRVNDNENRLRGSSGSSVNANHNAYHYWGRSVARLLLVEWIILVLGIAVIFREPRAERSFCLIPFLSYFDYGTNSYFMEKAALNILNVVLFLPVGFLLKLSNVNVSKGSSGSKGSRSSSGPKEGSRSSNGSSCSSVNFEGIAYPYVNWKGAMVVGLLISVVIEVLQFVFKRGLCEVDDVIHNVLGCMIGYGVASILKR